MTWSSGEHYHGRWLNDLPDGYGEAFVHGVHFAGNGVKGVCWTIRRSAPPCQMQNARGVRPA
jgi:hypothetical protein